MQEDPCLPHDSNTNQPTQPTKREAFRHGEAECENCNRSDDDIASPQVGAQSAGSADAEIAALKKPLRLMEENLETRCFLLGPVGARI
jgi:hypothetical protein